MCLNSLTRNWSTIYVHMTYPYWMSSKVAKAADSSQVGRVDTMLRIPDANCVSVNILIFEFKAWQKIELNIKYVYSNIVLWHFIIIVTTKRQFRLGRKILIWHFFIGFAIRYGTHKNFENDHQFIDISLRWSARMNSANIYIYIYSYTVILFVITMGFHSTKTYPWLMSVWLKLYYSLHTCDQTAQCC